MLERLGHAVAAFFQLFVQPDSKISLHKWLLGLVNLAAVVLFWVLSLFMVNDLFETSIYRKPFFITWLNMCCFSLFLVPYMRYNKLSIAAFVAQCRRRTKTDAEAFPEYGSREALPLKTGEEVLVHETMLLSLKFLLLWFTANLVTNASLSYTSVALQTILSSTASFFTLLVGYANGIERINTNKIVGILLSFTGVLIVTKLDSSSSVPRSSTPLEIFGGNILALSGALIYGIYTILLKKKVSGTPERELNTHLFFGFVGVFSLVAVAPVLMLLHVTNIERFALPALRYVYLLLATNAVITFISDFCWCKAVLLTSPLTVTVGLSTTIPLAMLGDWVFKSYLVNPWYVFGAAIVGAGFVVINRDEHNDFVEQL